MYPQTRKLPLIDVFVCAGFDQKLCSLNVIMKAIITNIYGCRAHLCE